MLHLTPLDYAVVGLFVAALLALGFSARLRDNSILQYLAAGRSLSMPAFVATLVSMWYGGILGVGESVETYGIGTWLLLGVPYYVFAFIYALFFAGRVRAADQISIPERLTARWGKSVGLVSAGMIFLLAVPAAHVLMLGVLLRAITGLDLKVAVVVATLGGSLFLYRGGLLADVRAGMLAFIMMYVGFVVVDGYCLLHYPPAAAFKNLEPHMFDWSGGGGVLTVIGFFVLGAWTMVDPGFHQRVASAATPEIGRKGVLVSIGCWFFFDVLSITAGLYAVALIHPMPESLSVYPVLGDRVLPPGLKAVFLCGMLGTILTAMVGYTLVSGATIGREIVARLNPGMNESQIKNWTRVGFVVACAVAIVLALGLNSVVDLWYDWGGVVIGALLLPVCAAYLPRIKLRSGSAVVCTAMAVAFFASFAWLIHGKRTDNADLEVYLAGKKFALGTLIPGLAISATILAIGEGLTRRIKRT